MFQEPCQRCQLLDLYDIDLRYSALLAVTVGFSGVVSIYRCCAVTVPVAIACLWGFCVCVLCDPTSTLMKAVWNPLPSHALDDDPELSH